MTEKNSDALRKLDELRGSLDGLGHLIGGEIVRGTATFTVTAPWIDEPLGESPEAQEAELEAAVRAARAAQPAWAATSGEERTAILLSIADAIEANAERIGDVLAAETGKPLRIARGEPMGAAAHIRYFAALEPAEEVIKDDDVERIIVVREPLGVVASITPWNGPLLMLANKVATALRCGNTVVAKPSPFTPFSSLLFGEIVRDLVPAGVINVIAGGDAIGQALTQHPEVDMVSFTGSIRAGQAITAQSAEGLKRLQLELGGNDAAVVLPDVDVDEVAERIYRGAFALSGQICAAIKRLYVHEDIIDDLTDALVEIAERQQLGSPWDPETTMGPLTTRPQYERVLGLINNAVDGGATLRTGGETIEHGGFFITPAIVTGVDHGVPLVDEEQFGPALPIMSFTDVEEVLERVNGTQYGLGGSVWSQDIDQAVAIARRIESGSAWINRHPHVGADVPFGGMKLSGVGREGGPESYEEFTAAKTISILK